MWGCLPVAPLPGFPCTAVPCGTATSATTKQAEVLGVEDRTPIGPERYGPRWGPGLTVTGVVPSLLRVVSALSTLGSDADIVPIMPNSVAHSPGVCI